MEKIKESGRLYLEHLDGGSFVRVIFRFKDGLIEGGLDFTTDRVRVREFLRKWDLVLSSSRIMRMVLNREDGVKLELFIFRDLVGKRKFRIRQDGRTYLIKRIEIL